MAIQGISIFVCALNILYMLRFPYLWPFALFNGLEVMFLTFSLLHTPKQISHNVLAWIASALIAIYPTLTPYLIHARTLPLWRESVSETLQLMALAWEMWAIFVLRGSFTQLPEAHRLVTKGPYRWMRHPLYAAYVVGFFGVAFAVMQPLFWGAFFLFVALEIIRALAEERVLNAQFLEYKTFAQQTGRFLPKSKKGVDFS